ncbi:ankyrin repeat-containing domain protein [Scenedesmus sp. NREL 46B-D3]|nr:ankyrin repeat-containing domain protein [Scenedesmus sp. NREL 46B-D3]
MPQQPDSTWHPVATVRLTPFALLVPCTWFCRCRCGCRCSFTPLYMAARRGHTHIVELLLAAGASNACSVGMGFTALHAASEQGHTAVVQALLKYGGAAAAAQPTRHGSMPVHLAAWSGHAACVRALLSVPEVDAKQHIVQEDSQGWTPL